MNTMSIPLIQIQRNTDDVEIIVDYNPHKNRIPNCPLCGNPAEFNHSTSQPRHWSLETIQAPDPNATITTTIACTGCGCSIQLHRSGSEILLQDYEWLMQVWKSRNTTPIIRIDFLVPEGASTNSNRATWEALANQHRKQTNEDTTSDTQR